MEASKESQCPPPGKVLEMGMLCHAKSQELDGLCSTLGDGLQGCLSSQNQEAYLCWQSVVHGCAVALFLAMVSIRALMHMLHAAMPHGLKLRFLPAESSCAHMSNAAANADKVLFSVPWHLHINNSIDFCSVTCTFCRCPHTMHEVWCPTSMCQVALFNFIRIGDLAGVKAICTSLAAQ
eukprot:4374067-Amphidinium_carterae.1